MLCTRRLLEVSDQISPVFLLLESSKHHLGARDVLLRVCQVDVKGVCAPCDALKQDQVMVTKCERYS